MLVYSAILLAAAAVTVAAEDGSCPAANILKPIPAAEIHHTPSAVAEDPALTVTTPPIEPCKNVSLNWGDKSEANLVNVQLEMKSPAVVLEDVAGVASVDCSANGVEVVFSSASAFETASAKWSLDGDFVLITNHMGDCDLENERGFFVVTQISADSNSMKITANAEKTDVASSAEYAEISFTEVHVPTPQNKRAITVGSDGVTISHAISLPDDTTLFKADPWVSVVAKKAEASGSVRLSGKVKFRIFGAKLDEFYFDLDTALAAELGLVVDVTAPYSNTFKYEPADLSYFIVNVPGIIQLGPSLGFDVGTDIIASAAVSVGVSVGAAIPNGNIHLDFLDMKRTGTSGWTPQYHARLDTSQRAQLTLNPFIDVTFALQVKVLGGLIDLSSGLVASPRFHNDFVLTASQTADPAGGVSQPSVPGSCDQGLRVVSDFDFSLTAFVTQWWRQQVYNVSVPIADECYSWQPKATALTI